MWQDQPGSSLSAGSTRQQTVGRINQVADYGDGDEDEDEIPSYAVLLTASVERFGVSLCRICYYIITYKIIKQFYVILLILLPLLPPPPPEDIKFFSKISMQEIHIQLNSSLKLKDQKTHITPNPL